MTSWIGQLSLVWDLTVACDSYRLFSMETLQSIRLDRVHRLESRSDQYVLAAVIALVIPVIRAALNKFVLLVSNPLSASMLGQIFVSVDT